MLGMCLNSRVFMSLRVDPMLFPDNVFIRDETAWKYIDMGLDIRVARQDSVWVFGDDLMMKNCQSI